MVGDDDETDASLKTCHLRGWVEPLANAIPKGTLGPDGSLPPHLFDGHGSLYRLTEGGWAVINRSQQLALLGAFLTVATLLVALV